MSLEADIRRDANPTPTRFLLECGAFTPGFGLGNYNPFDASLKFLNTGTPKAEFNPFDSSFKTPSTAISVVNNNINSSASQAQSQAQSEAVKKQQRGVERHPWANIVMDDMPMPMPQMSPGLSPSSSSSRASPSPPIASPPPSNFSLDHYHPSMTIPPHATDSNPFENNRNFTDVSPPKRPTHSDEYSRDISPASSDSYHYYDNQQQAVQQARDDRFSENARRASQNQLQFRPQYHNDDEEDGDDEHGMDMRIDSGVDEAMSALHMRRQSHESLSSAIERDLEPQSQGKSDVTAKTKKSSQATTGRKTSQRKRSRGQDESPEAKRQKFLERNRMAASKCREKKRLQTLKTISDADEITARNQALHETLDQLQEEVRLLKNQILSHHDCSCDVIQKFVQSTLDVTTPTSGISSSSSPSSSTNTGLNIGHSHASAFASSMHVFQEMIPVHPMQF
ncbi:Alcohol O-acetyltransferase [Linnemannia zychae]|nr:Alcohol O-acetyltransferase [Linnemannia zychae]